MVQYKLYYFPSRGRAEVIRLIFAVAGVEYEDIRISQTEWPQHKASMPMGQMPALEIDGVKLGQSKAVARYLAKKYGLAGKTEMEMYYVDCFSDTIDDIGMKYPFFEKDEAKKEELKKIYFSTTVVEGLANIEKLYRGYNKGKDCFLIGELTIADLAFISLLDILLPMKSDLLDGVPALKALYQRVHDHPKVKAWVAKRPQTEF